MDSGRSEQNETLTELSTRQRLEMEPAISGKPSRNRKYFALVALAVVLLVLLVVLLALVIAGNSSGRNSSSNTAELWRNYRLSNTTVPELYRLLMKPHISEGTFEGRVEITVNVHDPVEVIYLHIFNLMISETKLKKEKNGEEVRISKTFEYAENEYWVVVTEEKLEKGLYILQLSFNGSLTKSIVGFYRSVYTNKLTNQSRMLATTKFEPTFARRAFPCFDEPNKKANWSIAVLHNATEYPTVLSNMPEQSSKIQNDGLTKTTFETTIKMSTYLVCFIISDFTYLENKTTNGVKMRTYAPTDRIADTKFALDVATKLLDYFDDYFGIPYNMSISKLDLVSIPDFVSGAMENWGVVTFRETSLLYAHGKSSAGVQEKVAYVVSHELAHMWFGNLVTMDWWDDLWLNEGFATWIGFVLAMDYVNPEWNGDTKFLCERFQPVMVKDSMLSSHPIIMPMWHPDNFTSAFDAITYSKGAAVIRMLEIYLSREVFKEGIRKYIKKYTYRNAKTDELWEVLSSVSNKDVKTLMHAWTLTAGFPVVTYNVESSPQELRQEIFLSNPKEANSNKTDASVRWLVPVTAQHSSGYEMKPFLMDTAIHPLTQLATSEWTKFNKDEVGFYRVNYDLDTWNAIVNQLIENHTIFSVNDRCQLIDDAFELASASLLDYSVPLRMVKYIRNEMRNEPWYSFSRKIGYIDKMLRMAAPSTYMLFSEYIKSLSEPVLNQLDWDVADDKNNEKKLKKFVIFLTCKVGVTTCISNVSLLFEEWIKNDSFWLPSDYRRGILKYGMQVSPSLATWNTIWNRYLVASAEEKIDLIFALAKTPVPWILKLFMKFAENETFVRRQDYFTVAAFISSNQVGNPIMYAYAKENWANLVNRFTLNDRHLGRLVPKIVMDFNTRMQLDDVVAFFQKHPNAGAGAMPRKQAISNIEKNIDWVEKNVEKIDNWLKKHRQL